MRKLAYFASLVGIVAAQAAFAAAPVVVGTCVTSKTSFVTIQAAVDAAASTGTTTVQICPGVYPEQVTISKNVNLTGLVSGNQAQAEIVSPAGGVVVNATSPISTLPIAAQILVTGGAHSTISNLTVDGSNSGINGCTPNLVGILYQDASGIIKNNNVLNQALTGGLAGCQLGLAIYVRTTDPSLSAIVTVSGNQVSGYQKNGITGNEMGTQLTVSGNTVIGQGQTTGAAENAIQIGFGATGSVSSNTVGDSVWAPDVFGDTGDAAAGILLYAAGASSVRNNTVTSTQYGIAVEGDGNGDGDGASVTGNKISRTHLYDGIDVCGSSSASLTTNTINGSDEAAIHIDSSCGTPSAGNVVFGNKVNGACTGILVGPQSDTPTGVNTINNATAILTAGSDVCPAAAGSMSRQAAGHRRMARASRF